MEISLFSFIMAVVWNSVFIVLLYIGRKKMFFIKSFGVSSIVALYCFSAFRMVFPFEFPFTIVVNSNTIYPNIVDALYSTVRTESGNFNTWQVLCVVWLAAALPLIIKTCRLYIPALRKFCLMKPTEDEQIQSVLERVQKEYGKTMKIAVIKDESIPGAMSFGLIHKYILLPSYPLTDEELYCALSHEYIHLKNNDQWVKLLSTLYCNIFWWNPLSYLLVKDLERSLELKCDSRVLKEWSVNEKTAYMSTVIHEVRQKSESRRIKGAAYFLGKNEELQLKERFGMIMNPPVMQTNKAMSAVLVLLFVFSYSFVIQSKYEVPIEEIETEAGAYEVSEDEVYIRKNVNGEYEFVDPYGSMVISEEMAKECIEDGCYYEREEYP